MRNISLLGGVLGLLAHEEFKNQYGSQSGRIGLFGFVSMASNAGIPVKLRGQHGDWASFKSHKRYMEVMLNLFIPFLWRL
jgi:hypothetical protein